MVAFAAGWVCSTCKPRYAQELKEGVGGMTTPAPTNRCPRCGVRPQPLLARFEEYVSCRACGLPLKAALPIGWRRDERAKVVGTLALMLYAAALVAGVGGSYFLIRTRWPFGAHTAFGAVVCVLAALVYVGGRTCLMSWLKQRQVTYQPYEILRPGHGELVDGTVD